MSQYKIQSRPFNDERLPYSGRSLAANRENRTRVTGIQIRVNRTFTATGTCRHPEPEKYPSPAS